MTLNNKKKICVVTGTRAEYGLLYNTLLKLHSDSATELQIIATGMHLSTEFGLTYKLIEKDGFNINKKVEIVLSSDSPTSISKSTGLGVIGFSEAYEDLQPDLIFVVGDRFEIMAACLAATIHKIPIAHCHGGETTQGAIDESFRHSITKMSHIHFVAAETYRKRVIQLGEDPDTVHVVGALGLEFIRKNKLLNKGELSQVFNFNFQNDYILICYHPVTLEIESPEDQIQSIIEACERFTCSMVFTMANADTHGRIINRVIEEYTASNPHRAICLDNPGQVNYLSLLKNASVLVGNSSSGIIEAPSLHTYTVNIGDRQKGRIKAKSVIDCLPNTDDIENSIKKTQSISSTNDDIFSNPYQSKGSSSIIVDVLKGISTDSLLKKQFYDLPGFIH